MIGIGTQQRHILIGSKILCELIKMILCICRSVFFSELSQAFGLRCAKLRRGISMPHNLPVKHIHLPGQLWPALIRSGMIGKACKGSAGFEQRKHSRISIFFRNPVKSRSRINEVEGLRQSLIILKPLTAQQGARLILQSSARNGSQRFSWLQADKTTPFAEVWP